MRKAVALFGVVTMVAALAFALAACNGSPNVEGPVYLKARQVYYDTSTGDARSEMIWEYDSRGNEVKRVTKKTSDGTTIAVEDTFGDFDQDGYPATNSATNGSETSDLTYEYTRENGRIVKRIASSGSETEYTYYDSGQVKTMKMTTSTGAASLFEYDENGYRIKTESSGSSSSDNNNSTIMWTMSDDGTPTNMVFNSTSSGKSQIPVSYTVQCDDNGNIVRVYTALGKLYEEVEYVKIDNPSLSAWVHAHMIDG